jgi:hypothetical protein
MSEEVDVIETDEDDEYLKMLTLIGRSEALDTHVAVHEVCHYQPHQWYRPHHSGVSYPERKMGRRLHRQTAQGVHKCFPRRKRPFAQ